jgi:hypothetical protein
VGLEPFGVCICINQFTSRKPEVRFWAITKPTDQVLFAMSSCSLVDDLINEIFNFSICCYDWAQFLEGSGREEFRIIFDACVQEGRVEGAVDLGRWRVYVDEWGYALRTLNSLSNLGINLATWPSLALSTCELLPRKCGLQPQILGQVTDLYWLDMPG